MPRSGPYRRHVGELRLATVLAVPDIPRHSRYGCCTFEIACCCTKHHSGEKKESAESATTGAGRVRSASCAKASARLNRARIIREGGANVATNVERNACLRRENMAPLRPLIIDATAKAKAARVLAHAEKNHYRPGPDVPPPGDHERFVAYLNTYRAVFTFAHTGGMILRHLSISVWLRVSLAVWRCGASSSRCWRPPGRTMRGIGGGTSRAFRLKDGRGADLENAVSEYCRHFCSG